MSSIAFTRSPIGHSAAAAVRAILKPVQSFFVAWINRREVATLLAADPAMLRDLGLTPMDVSCALAEPIWKDPSARLLIWSIERRAAARAAARENLDGLGVTASRRTRDHQTC